MTQDTLEAITAVLLMIIALEVGLIIHFARAAMGVA